MKRLIFLFAAMVGMALTATADPIDPSKAAEIASRFTVQEPLLVKRAVRNAAKARVLAAKTIETSPYYIYSRGENQGFVIVSGDDCLPEVLGYTESGDFDPETASPQLLGWLDYYARIIEDAQAAGENRSRSASQGGVQERLAKATVKQDIAPLMTTHWHQTWPYNSFCPFLKGTTNRAVTGCVATAGSQVVYYYRKDNPSTLLSTTPTYGYGDAPVTTSVPKGTPMKWDLMLDSYGTQPQEYADAVGEFVFALGAATWLTYGSSTAGQISNLVGTFNGCFNLSSECIYKGGIAQSTWENMIYEDLLQGHPMVYCGYNEAQGGHAVVVDGYQASTNLFHFNFGWGGQGDGWFTVDDKTGMNGFNSEQGMTYKVQPKKQNLSAKVTAPSEVFLNTSNTIKVKVANNGTLPYSGVYAFLSSKTSKPTNISDANDKDVETLLPADGTSHTLAFSVKPTRTNEVYLTITDRNLNVLATAELSPKEGSNDLVFKSMDILGSSDTEQHNGEFYQVIYAKRTFCKLLLENLSDIPFEDAPSVEIYGSDDDGKTFELVGKKTASNSSIPAKGEVSVSITLSSTTSCPIEAGRLYYIALSQPLSSKVATNVTVATSEPIARFVMRENDEALAATIDGQTLVFSGRWDANQFITLTGRTANKNATNYDLTAVRSVGLIPAIEAKPNAIFYVAEDSKATGCNVVKATSGKSASIALTSTADFMPLDNINAEEFSLTIDAPVDKWFLLTTPVTVSVPQGWVAKEITGHSSLGINKKGEIVNEMQGGHTYLVMKTSSRYTTLTAKNVTIVAQPAENADAAIVGTYSAMNAPTGSFVVSNDETQYFEPVKTDGVAVSAFGGYFFASDVKNRFRPVTDTSVDGYYLSLAQELTDAWSAVEEYSPYIAPSATETFVCSISDVENFFTQRPSTVRADIQAKGAELAAQTESYKEKIQMELLDDERDMTSLIVNPSFENGTLASSTTGSTKGWTVEGTATVVRDATGLDYRGVGADGKYALYSYAENGALGSGISQTIADLPAGLYRLSAKVGSDAGNEITLFANEQEIAAPAHPFGKYYLADAEIDNIIVQTGTELTIGIKTGKWYKADDFRLTYVRALTPEEDPVAITAPHISENLSIVLRPFKGGVTIVNLRQNSQVVTVRSLSGATIAVQRVDQSATISLPSGLYLVGNQKVLVK